MSTASLYDDLDAEDLPPQEAFPVSGDLPVEGPRQFEEPPMPTPEAPGPEAQAVEDAFVPPVPAEAPGNIGAPAPLPGAEPIVLPEAPPTEPGSDLGEREKAQKVEEAKVAGATVDEQARLAKEHDEDARLAYADYLEQRKAAEQRYEKARTDYEKANSLNMRPGTDARPKATVYRIFSALAGPERHRMALQNLQQEWENDRKLAQGRIDALKDNYITARTGLQDVDAGRRLLKSEADAFYTARLANAERQGRAQLAHLGVPKAEIEGDERILSLKAARLKAEREAAKDRDAHALTQARIRYMDARAAKAKKVAGGGGGGSNLKADVAQYLIDHPGDTPGARRLAAGRIDDKSFDKIVNQTKSTESQTKAAEFGRAGVRAVEQLEKSKYVPTEADTQRWLNNQRDVYQAQQAGTGGGLSGLVGGKIAGGLQAIGAMAKSEVEGLSPEGQLYFANVRRLMEPLGRAKSGAAISQGEWVNFFNQYGPQSSGGYAAARKDLEDQLKLSGVAGRSLAGGGGKAEPAKADGRWVPVPTRLADKYKGKTELQIDAGNKVIGSR